jgi:hypothetical protein
MQQTGSRLHVEKIKLRTTGLSSRKIYSRSPDGLERDFDFVAKIAMNLIGVDPEGRVTFYLEQLRGGIIVPLNDHSIFLRFPFWSDDTDAEPRSLSPQPRKNCTCDSVKDLLWIP